MIKLFTVSSPIESGMDYAFSKNTQLQGVYVFLPGFSRGAAI
jgi:hypothetical protein